MNRVMIVFTVPPDHLAATLDAMAAAGAGCIGSYSHCAFVTAGKGRFLPAASATPTLGLRGQINTAAEVRVESFCPREQAQAVVAAIRAAHPYEEAVIYVLPLLDEAALSSAASSV